MERYKIYDTGSLCLVSAHRGVIFALLNNMER